MYLEGEREGAQSAGVREEVEKMRKRTQRVLNPAQASLRLLTLAGGIVENC